MSFKLLRTRQRGDFVAEVTDPLTPAMQKFKAALYDNGLFTMLRGHQVRREADTHLLGMLLALVRFVMSGQGQLDATIDRIPASLARMLLRWRWIAIELSSQVFLLPPLIIKPEEISEGFDILDKCLHIMDEAMEN